MDFIKISEKLVKGVSIAHNPHNLPDHSSLRIHIDNGKGGTTVEFTPEQFRDEDHLVNSINKKILVMQGN